jgi:hypothetical protein
MITQNEKAVIFAIAQNEMNGANYGVPTDTFDARTYTWTLKHGAYIIPEDLEVPSGKSLSGTVSSLVQKGLVSANGNGDDATVGLTDEGLSKYQSYRKQYDEICEANGTLNEIDRAWNRWNGVK